MTSTDAKKQLREWQAQIIHGKNHFGDIADVIERMEIALLIAGETFREYEALHRAKSALKKAEANKEKAQLCENATTGSSST